MDSLKEQFLGLCRKYISGELPELLWKEIREHYSAAGRYYHTLDHLAAMFDIITAYEDGLEHKEAVWFAVWFHDIIYNSKRSDNEEQSAVFAREALHKLKVPEEVTAKAAAMILMTKTHTSSHGEFDVALFLDADLAVLGSEREEYDRYRKAVRKEYSQYPGILYKAGRKKVLRHFLDLDFIYKTKEMRAKLEEKARGNLAWELEQL